MNNIIEFRPRRNPTRIEAAQWLCLHFEKFPEIEGDCSEDLFHGWRFVRDEYIGVHFTNFIEKCIREKEFLEFLEMEMAE